MPGSRVKEVRMNLPTIVESAALLGGSYEFLLPVAPTLDTYFIHRLVEESLAKGGSGGKEGVQRTKNNPRA